MSVRRLVSGLRIVVFGYIIRCPLGGLAWHHLQYVLGLSQLGHDVLFVEDSGDQPWACYNPTTHVTGPDPSYGLEFASQVFRKVGLPEHWAYHNALAGSWHGPAAGRVRQTCRTADLLLNLSGSNVLRDWSSMVPSRVYVDTDPAFTQLRHVIDPARREHALSHNAFFSFGECAGSHACHIPDDGISWQPTRQPVVLDAWPVSPGPPGGRLTTVMQWDDDSTLQGIPLAHCGRPFGRKRPSFEPLLGLPLESPRELELAVGGATAPLERLRQHRWWLRDALEVTRDPWTYQDYIRSSMAEFSVAKQAYVASSSGWFSERSACYLASGRPVIVEETGFSSWMKSGMGVLPFGNLVQAQRAIEDLVARYQDHCEAARELAGQYFASERVLNDLIDRVLI